MYITNNKKKKIGRSNSLTSNSLLESKIRKITRQMLNEEVTLQDIMSKNVKLPKGYTNTGLNFVKKTDFDSEVTILPNIKNNEIDGWNITIRFNSLSDYLSNAVIYKREVYKGDFDKMFTYIDDIVDEWEEIRNEFEDFKKTITAKTKKFNTKYKLTN